MPRATPVQTPERVSGYLTRVHCSDDKAPPITAWYAVGAATTDLRGAIGGAHRKAFSAHLRQRPTLLSAPVSTLRMARL